VLKLQILQRAMEQRPGLRWDSPELKHLDHLYSSVDPNEGLYWAYERNGFAKRVVSEARIERFIHEPPEDTRAWTRTMLLRAAGPAFVDQVDWNHMRFRLKSNGYWPRYATLDLPNPLRLTKAESESILRKGGGLERILDALGAAQTENYSRTTRSDSSTEQGAYTFVPSPPLLPTVRTEGAGEPDIQTRSNDITEQDGGQDDEIS
jgi:hypothetical protein